jgi:hypothetical protein
MSNLMNILRAVFVLHEDNMANMSLFLYVFNAIASEMKDVQYVLMDAIFVVCFSIVSQDTFLSGIRYESFYPPISLLTNMIMKRTLISICCIFPVSRFILL